MSTTALRQGAVRVTGRFVAGTTRRDVLDGQAVLAITDLGTGAEVPYWCRALYDGGRCTGFRLSKMGTAASYFVARDLSRCTCPSARWHPGRPGGCRHQAALREALTALAGRRPRPDAAPAK